MQIEDLLKTYDAVILATGRSNLKLKEIKYKEKGIDINTDNFRTSKDKVFACGNAVRPIKMEVISVAQGRGAALAVDSFLKKKEFNYKRRFNSKSPVINSEEKEIFIKKSKIIVNKTDKDNSRYIEYTPDQAKTESELCLRCNCLKPDSCKLRDYAQEYKATGKAFKTEKKNDFEKYYYKDIVFEPGKCIKCGICITVTEKHNEKYGFTFIGKGFNVKIGIPMDKSLENAVKKTGGLCAGLCPTGAIAIDKS